MPYASHHYIPVAVDEVVLCFLWYNSLWIQAGTCWISPCHAVMHSYFRQTISFDQHVWLFVLFKKVLFPFPVWGHIRTINIACVLQLCFNRSEDCSHCIIAAVNVRISETAHTTCVGCAKVTWSPQTTATSTWICYFTHWNTSLLLWKGLVQYHRQAPHVKRSRDHSLNTTLARQVRFDLWNRQVWVLFENEINVQSLYRESQHQHKLSRIV